ncbi:MAG: zinc-ribbon domain-containing protein [[Clostridium] cocleatum]|nr:zinc-ribbon domain-containing protein [Thomasclavelia cocleata]
MAMIKCPKCGEDISDKSTTCIHCGHVLIEESKVFCEECGAEIEKMKRFVVNAVVQLISRVKMLNSRKLKVLKQYQKMVFQRKS